MSTPATGRQRPLSPFMIGQYYRPQLTSMLSITHRVTGVALALASVGLVLWLVALASGSGAYSKAMECAASPLGSLLLLALGSSLAFHFSNGIRHLFWDAGRGFEIKAAYASGYAVLAFTAAVTLGLIWFLFFPRGAP